MKAKLLEDGLMRSGFVVAYPRKQGKVWEIISTCERPTNITSITKMN
jgi:hypothetical protein